jgi:hypothetical protein
MLLTHRSLRVIAISALSLSTLTARPQSPAPSSSAPAPATTSHVVCAPMAANLAIPSRAAIEAKITNFDSAHLKPGKDVWFKLARPFYYTGCSLDADSVVYARVVSVSPSEVSLAFDRADCNHRDQQPLKLRVIAIVGPPNESHHMHEDLPSEVAGGARQMGQAVYGTDAFDEELNPGGPPHTIHPGVVVGIKDIKLEPTAGPECSDKISTEGNRLQLASGSEFILALTVTRVVRQIQKPAAPAPHP